MQFLYFLEQLRTPFLTSLMAAVTHLGDETCFIVIALCIYWCISKKWACYVLAVSFLGTLVNQFAKIIFRVPRPWVQDPNFSIVESARAAASGYSFPSGHTANITCTLGASARACKKAWLRIAAVILILVVGFSRMYLGVHFPSDVLFSLGISAVMVFAIYPVYRSDKNLSRRIYVSFGILTVLSLCFVLFLAVHTWPSDIDLHNLNSARKNSFMLVGCALGMITGIYVDKRWLNFSVAAPWWAQILKVAVGLAILLGLKSGLKPVLPAALWSNSIRYFLVTVFATCIWPLTFPWFARGMKRKSSECQ